MGAEPEGAGGCGVDTMQHGIQAFSNCIYGRNNVELIELWFKALRRWHVVKGRSTRPEFFAFVLVNKVVIGGLVAAVAFALSFLDSLINLPDLIMPGVFSSAVLFLFLGVPTVTLTMRRFQDTGRNGWQVPILMALMPCCFMLVLGHVPEDGMHGLSGGTWQFLQSVASISLWCIPVYSMFVVFSDSQRHPNKWGLPPEELIESD